MLNNQPTIDLSQSSFDAGSFREGITNARKLLTSLGAAAPSDFADAREVCDALNFLTQVEEQTIEPTFPYTSDTYTLLRSFLPEGAEWLEQYDQIVTALNIGIGFLLYGEQASQQSFILQALRQWLEENNQPVIQLTDGITADELSEAVIAHSEQTVNVFLTSMKKSAVLSWLISRAQRKPGTIRIFAVTGDNADVLRTRFTERQLAILRSACYTIAFRKNNHSRIIKF